MLYIVLAVLWWTFAVVLAVVLITDTRRDTKDVILIIGLSVFWPVTAVAVAPVLVYQACVASTTQIRADLKNRQILAEFETWLAERDKYKSVSE